MKRFPMLFLMLAGMTCSAVFAASPVTSDKDRAVSALEEDVKTDPNNSELWLHLGFAYRKLEKIEDAQKAFEKVVALSPQTKDAYFMLGLIYESKHQNAQAADAWKHYMALEKDPDRRNMAQKHIHHVSE